VGENSKKRKNSSDDGRKNKKQKLDGVEEGAEEEYEAEGSQEGENEEPQIVEVGADREHYPEEREKEEKERDKSETESKESVEKEHTPKLPAVPEVQGGRPGARYPPLKDQIRVALESKDIDEIDKLVKVLLTQHEQLRIRFTRLQRQNEEFTRQIQGQMVNFNREKYHRESLLQQLARERDELRLVIARAQSHQPRAPAPQLPRTVPKPVSRTVESPRYTSAVSQISPRTSSYTAPVSQRQETYGYQSLSGQSRYPSQVQSTYSTPAASSYSHSSYQTPYSRKY